ncbi:MAG TPA: DUF5777 family beta-barrel protein [Flavobacteriaceae bacterium]|nr:DUF5777 family beta-barrel protein [Flavobacteriaceae bacterium]
MKNIKILIWALAFLPFVTFAQEETTEKQENKPERAAYESSLIIDNNTNVTFVKGTLEVVMQHRFGTVNGGTNDLLGIWAPANIRIGLAYSFTDNITIGAGTTKDGRMQDFNAKVALLKQTRSNSIPVNVTYFGNLGIDARTRDNFKNVQDRYSYFNQLIISRRMNSSLSLQIAPSVAHYNLVPTTQKNDLIAVSMGGRYKISPQTAILFDYTQPITEFAQDAPEPGLSLGVEFATSAHAFQLYFTNYKGILNQRSQFNNQNDFFNGDFMLGFTITRRYNF